MNRLFIKSEFLLHLLFWTILIVFFVINNEPTFKTDDYFFIGLKFTFRFLPFIVLLYTNVIYLIPTFFIKRKYLLYSTSILLLWLIGTPIAIVGFNQIERWFHFVAEPNFIEPIGTNAYWASLILFFITSFITFLFQLMRQQSQYSLLQNLHLNTELDLLKNQINPHFFFNTLNNLNGLVLENSKDASRVIVRLSEMMRYSLYECQAEKVFLKKEIQYLDNYLYLQKIRSRHPVDITFEQIGIAEDTSVPPLLFIVFVENAFKHGLVFLEKSGFVKILIEEQAKHIFFSIQNNYADKVQKNRSNGLGIQNVKKRLALLYQEQCQVQITDEQNIFTIQINLPKKDLKK